MNTVCRHLNRPEVKSWVVQCQECFDAVVEQLAAENVRNVEAIQVSEYATLHVTLRTLVEVVRDSFETPETAREVLVTACNIILDKIDELLVNKGA